MIVPLRDIEIMFGQIQHDFYGYMFDYLHNTYPLCSNKWLILFAVFLLRGESAQDTIQSGGRIRWIGLKNQPHMNNSISTLNWMDIFWAYYKIQLTV